MSQLLKAKGYLEKSRRERYCNETCKKYSPDVQAWDSPPPQDRGGCRSQPCSPRVVCLALGCSPGPPSFLSLFPAKQELAGPFLPSCCGALAPVSGGSWAGLGELLLPRVGLFPLSAVAGRGGKAAGALLATGLCVCKVRCFWRKWLCGLKAGGGGGTRLTTLLPQQGPLCDGRRASEVPI